MDSGRENCTKSDGIRMKSEMKFREKLMRNETLRKRCDIKSDREKPYDSHDSLESHHRIATTKYKTNQLKTKSAQGSQFYQKIGPKWCQNPP